ncbi:MAG: hypothetical protein ACI9OJ_003199 [Myxococcota bacterium]
MPAAPTIHTEFTIVLPQRYRASVVKVLPWHGRSVLLLVRDFKPADEGEGRPEFAGLEPVWRLYLYEPPNTVAIEVCVFTQPADEAALPVHAAVSGDRVFLLFHNQLLEVNVEGRSVETVCRLQLPGSEGADVTARCIAVRDSTVALTVCADDDDLSVHWVPLDSSGDPYGTRYSGARGERLAFGANGETYVLDMMDVYCFVEGEQTAHRDFATLFGRWHRSPTELLAVMPNGQLVVGGGGVLIAVTPDLTGVLGTWTLGSEADDMAWADGTKTLLLSRSDPVAGTVTVRSVSL